MQLIAETRQPIPAAPGQLERYDDGYRRNGAANLFVFFNRHRAGRKVELSHPRAAGDFAQCMRDPVDIHYPGADQMTGRCGSA